MTEHSLTANPPYGSVESYARILRSCSPRYLAACGLDIVQMIAVDRDVADAVRLQRISNVIAAVAVVDTVAARAAAALTPDADLSGFGYSRADDEGPAEDMTLTRGRIEPHFEDGREASR